MRTQNKNELDVAIDVVGWQMEGRWIDRGRWIRVKGRPEYWPTQSEIAAKCSLFRTRDGRHGAHVRSPRGGEFAIATTAGI